ncbi:MAG: restriction endonuclease subunit M [Gemmataceae bacterium]|nr:restriction endonuclease subunit M [Gemmataceae bacterium]
MTAPREIIELIDRFARNSDSYRSGNYNETQVRREFIDPFFKCLGWDIDNTAGFAEAYKDVIHEDAIKVGGVTKAPDYCFRVGGTRKFFLEAKRPSINLKIDPEPAFQLRRYAWSAKLPLSVLTDFEEFAVYDCRIKPAQTDKATAARVRYLTFTDYAEQWDTIAATFSKDAVLKGLFDKYAETSKLKKDTATVDTAFLKEIEGWRETLAKNIALRNPQLSQRELNYAVQVTIDRVLFLRMCEDRGVEHYGQLGALQNGAAVYGRLQDLFRKADERYNSGLFHFTKEPDRPESHDELTTALNIDDKLLKEIFKSLYYPDSPYEFSVLPAEILGQVYEQFLGKVIRLTDNHRAIVEEKPDVRKAGGVYYTPTYIVDYIVKNTVGKLLEGKTPRQAAKLRVLDPACGSGSFLLGAYQFLLDWYRDRYIEASTDKPSKELFQGRGGAWHLTSAEKKRILLNNIYGVDIDPQAVEVTKLSLLLKVLEGESQQTLERQLFLFHERALPDLASNIKCGNSLIGPDFYDGQQLTLFDEEERYRINVFDWNAKFPAIMKAGGFDAVIGNPPYIPIEMMSEYESKYFQARHPELERKYDSSVIFILSLLQRLSSSGLVGFISSVTWQTGENYAKLRERLFKKAGVCRLVNLPFDVFKDAYVDTGVYVLSRSPSAEYSIYCFAKKRVVADLEAVKYNVVNTGLVTGPDYKVILNPGAQLIFNRVSADPKFSQLGSFSISTQGLAGNRFAITSLPLLGSYPFLTTGQAHRYELKIEKAEYTTLEDSPSLRRFYEAEPKILIRRVISRQDRLLATYSDAKMVFKKDINPFLLTSLDWNVFYVLGILNSRLISYLYVNTSSIATKDDFRQTTLAELRRLPIPKMPNDAARTKNIGELASQMLTLHKQLSAAKTPHEKKSLETQIAATDWQIDNLVYELYGLTPEEIKIVEQAGSETASTADADKATAVMEGTA